MYGKFWFSPHVAGPPKTPENEDLYAWKIAENEHFDAKCIARNVSTIDALLEHGMGVWSEPAVVEFLHSTATLSHLRHTSVCCCQSMHLRSLQQRQ